MVRRRCARPAMGRGASGTVVAEAEHQAVLGEVEGLTHMAELLMIPRQTGPLEQWSSGSLSFR